MRTSLVRVFIATLMAAGTVAADTIAIDGRVYENVLVYEGNSAYYVKIPGEGRVISAPKDEVSASSISINDDPYYRDQLKARYDRVRSGEQAAELASPSAPSDPAFQAPDTIAVASGSGQEGVSAGGGGGGSLNASRQDVESILQSSGFQNQGGVWKGANGLVSVNISGPDDNINSVVATVSGNMAQVMQGMGQVNGLISKFAPWAPAWVQQNQGALLSSGFIETAQQGVYLSISGQQQEQNLTVTATIRGA